MFPVLFQNLICGIQLFSSLANLETTTYYAATLPIWFLTSPNIYMPIIQLHRILCNPSKIHMAPFHTFYIHPKFIVYTLWSETFWRLLLLIPKCFITSSSWNFKLYLSSSSHTWALKICTFIYNVPMYYLLDASFLFPF